MRTLMNPRDVADRLRMATVSLTNSHDIAIARQYVHELEAMALHLQVEEARKATEIAFFEYGQCDDADEKSIAEASEQDFSLTASRLYGQHQMASTVEESSRD